MENILTLTYTYLLCFQRTRYSTIQYQMHKQIMKTLHLGAMVLNIRSRQDLVVSLHMIKRTQDGETFQRKKIQNIFSAEKIMCENCQGHNGSCIMIPTPKPSFPVLWLRVWKSPLRCMWAGTSPFIFHVYVIRKYSMVSVTVRIRENYKKASHVSFCN